MAQYGVVKPPERTFDEESLRGLFREQPIHPDDIGSLLGYLPAALTDLCWRNTVLEEWHAGQGSRISDAEMMRASVSTSRIFSTSLRCAFADTWADAGHLSPEQIDTDILSEAFAIALEDAFTRERVLPHGVTLGELGGDQADELYEYAAVQLNGMLDLADAHGAHVPIMWLSLRGMMMVPLWWGTPRWPFVVDEFFRRLDDPHHEHWHLGTGHPGPPPAPADERTWFRRKLMSAPEELPTEIVDYCLHGAALGFIIP